MGLFLNKNQLHSYHSILVMVRLVTSVEYLMKKI